MVKRFVWICVLFLFVALNVEWARSYWHPDALVYHFPALWRSDHELFRISVCYGVLDVEHEERQSRPVTSMPSVPIAGNFEIDGYRFDTYTRANFLNGNTRGGPLFLWAFGRVKFDHEDDPGNGSYFSYHGRGAYFPFWMVVAPLGIILSVKLKTLREYKHRVKMGLCLHCGYDLRASIDRCPECGAVVSKEANVMSGG